MSSFYADKKKEYEDAAYNMLKKNDFESAFFYTCQAVKYTFYLAEQCGDGKLAAAYIQNANEGLEIAARLKEKIKNQKRNLSEGKIFSGTAEKISATTGVAESAPAPAAAATASSNSSGITLDDVKGLAEAKKIVRDALIDPIRHPDIYSKLKIKPGTGLLLYGPPGTGKTMFAKAIANEMHTHFMHVKLNELKSKYVGETETNIANMFSEARSHKRCVLFLDECETMLRKRGNQKVCMVEQFLVELDGIQPESDCQLFVMLATNRPWLIDSAITRSGRISAMVYVDLPDEEARLQIITSALKDIPLADDVDINELVALTKGYSGAEISHKEKGGGVCDEAPKFAKQRWIARREKLSPDDPEYNRVELVTRSDFELAMKSVTPTSLRDRDIIEKNKAFSNGPVVSDRSDEQDDNE